MKILMTIMIMIMKITSPFSVRSRIECNVPVLSIYIHESIFFRWLSKSSILAKSKRNM